MAVRIDVLMPTMSQYEVLHHFAQKLHEAFLREGAASRLLSGDERYFATMNSPPDFTVGFNGGLKVDEGHLFCDVVKVPHVACLVDPPYRFPELIQSPFTIITCEDTQGCRMLKDEEFRRTFFLPHAVEPELSPDPGFKRIYDIVFLGTCIDAENRKKKWKKKFAPEIIRLMEEAASVGLDDTDQSFMSFLAAHLDPWEYRPVFEEVEIYIKGCDRLRLIEACSRHTIHVFGGSNDSTGWEKQLKGRANVEVHPAISFEQSLQVMQQSKIVLNSSIKNKFGAHERVFSAAASGAVVVTNDNPFIRQYFHDGKDILLYNSRSLKLLGLTLNKLLEDEKQWRRIADAGRKIVMEGHTWDNRARLILKEVKPYLKNMKKLRNV